MRIILINLVLFLLPFAIYAIYVSVKNQTLASGGDWNERKIAALSAVGLVFVMIGLAIWHVQDSTDNSVNPLLQFDRPEREPEPEPERPRFGGPF